MPIQTILDNTYYIFDSLGTALLWNAGSRIQQIRILSLSTTATVEFQAVAGTPVFRWNYLANGSTNTFAPSMYVIPMGGVSFPTAWIPTTLTAATAWIDFA